MKKFRFKLESLLQYREHLERIAQQEVAKARSNIVACEENITRLKNEHQKISFELDSEVATGIVAERYKLYTAYIYGIESSVASEEKRLQNLLKVFKEKQNILTQKSIEKKVIENLKGRKKEEYYDNMFKNIQKESDDTIITRKARDMNK